MTELDGAFMKLRVARENLVRWLNAPTPSAARWTDWRELGGDWYFSGGPRPIAGLSEAELSEEIGKCEGLLSAFPTNRDAIHGLLDDGDGETWQTRRITYDDASRDFVAGALLYAENLIPILAFVTVARGASQVFGPDAHGIAVVNNYVFGDPAKGEAVTALRIGPSDHSSFLAPAERASAVAVFEALAGEIMAGEGGGPHPVDQLATLR